MRIHVIGHIICIRIGLSINRLVIHHHRILIRHVWSHLRIVIRLSVIVALWSVSTSHHPCLPIRVHSSIIWLSHCIWILRNLSYEVLNSALSISRVLHYLVNKLLGHVRICLHYLLDYIYLRNIIKFLQSGDYCKV